MYITIDEIIMIPPLVIDLVDSFRTWHSRCQRLYVFRRHQFVAISIKNVKRRTHLNIRHFYRQRPMSRILRHTVFPRIVPAQTILFWKWKMWKFSYSFPIMDFFLLHKLNSCHGNYWRGGNYSRKYGIQLLIF